MKNQLKYFLTLMMFFSTSHATEESDAPAAPCSAVGGHGAPASDALVAQREMFEEIKSYLSPKDECLNTVIAEWLCYGGYELRSDILEDHAQLMSFAEAGDPAAQALAVKVLVRHGHGPATKEDLYKLREVAIAGWPGARSEFVKILMYRYRYEQEMQKLAFVDGWEEAQDYIVSMVVSGVEGSYFRENFNLEDLALNKQWKYALELFLSSVAKEHPARFKELSTHYKARQDLVARGLLEGTNGFDKDMDRFNKLAEDGCKRARYIKVWGLLEGKDGFAKDLDEVKRLALEEGWEEALSLVIEGVTKRNHGFTHDPVLLRSLGERGDENAQLNVVIGLFYGYHGFVINRDEVKRLADLGWKYAQKTIGKELVLVRNFDRLRDLACNDYRRHRNLNNPYVLMYFQMAPLLEKVPFLRALPDLGRSELGWEWIRGAVRVAKP